jgi:heme exporter protein A
MLPGMAIDIDTLSRRFGARWVLVRANASFPSGSGTLLLGPNGAGKTTLLRCLATSLKPHGGFIRADGRDLWKERRALRPEIAFLSHQTCVYDDLSALDNLRFWDRLSGGAADLSAVLVRVGLDPKRKDPARTYSAGMKRRLALGRILLRSPRVALFDEPFASLDPEGRDLVAGVLAELRAQGTTLIVATHLPAEGRRVCDREIRLESGRVVS